MPADFHAGLFSIKKEHQLHTDMHWNAKRLMGQSLAVRGLLRDFRNAVEKHNRLSKEKGKEKDAQAQKEKLLRELEEMLKKIEGLFVVEEREEDLVVRYGATGQKLRLEDIRLNVIDETMQLAYTHQIPPAYADEIKKEVAKLFAKIRDEIKKEAETALVERRGGISFRMGVQKACLILKNERAMARREKRRTFKAEHVLETIESMKKRVKEVEELHELDQIRDYLVKEAEAGAEVIHYIASSIVFCLMFMDKIKSDFKELKKEIKEIGNPARLTAIEKKIEEEWQAFMNDISKVLQQLRFSVAPGEMKAAA